MRAAMTAAEIAEACGSARRSGVWSRSICPVHGSRTCHSPTLALRDSDRGLVVHCHAGCSRDDIIAELRHMGLLAGPSGRTRLAPAEARCDDRADLARRIEIAQRIWEAGTDVRGSPVVRYLAGRGITIPLPSSLRWAPSPHRIYGTSHLVSEGGGA